MSQRPTPMPYEEALATLNEIEFGAQQFKEAFGALDELLLHETTRQVLAAALSALAPTFPATSTMTESMTTHSGTVKIVVANDLPPFSFLFVRTLKTEPNT